MNCISGGRNNKDMYRNEQEYINEVWYGDSCIGPYLLVDGKKQRTNIFVLMDDCSKMVVGIDIFLNESHMNLMSVIESAISKYGEPTILSFDNGRLYKDSQMSLLADKIGITLNYGTPYPLASRAKIERWVRTLNDHWLAGLNMADFNSLEELRTSLLTYAQFYNQTVHSTINGLAPQEQYFKDVKAIRMEESNNGRK